ncbi:MAG: hypothetical protein GX589_09970 [Deltaproteobacteria bacterium]|nr:hypothetical protein [Deltaproteobacteria bacterium]
MTSLLPQKPERGDQRDALLLSAVSFNGKFREELPVSKEALVPFYQSQLKVLAPVLDLNAVRVGFEISIKGQEEPETRLFFHHIGEQFKLVHSLDQAWDTAGKYLHPSDRGYASLMLPYPSDQTHRPRLHVATPWKNGGFDRIMEVVKFSCLHLWDNELMDGVRELEIVAEPLVHHGVKHRDIVDMGFAIGSTWMNFEDTYFFPGYTTWRPKLGRFERAFFYQTGD